MFQAIQTRINRAKNIINTYPKLSVLTAGALYALAMPPMFLWPLAFLAFGILVPLLIKTDNARKAGLLAALFFFSFHLIGLHWISNALLVNWTHYFWLYPFSLIGLPALLSLFAFITVTTACGLTKRNHTPRLAAIIAALIVAEYARATLFTGFPWNMPAHIWRPHWLIAQSASVIGMMGVSLLTLILLCICTVQGWIKWLPCLCIILALCTINTPADTQDTHAITVIAVQPNIPQSEKWDPSLQQRNLDKRFDITANALAGTNNQNTLVIWPETALSYVAIQTPVFQDRLKAVLSAGAYLLTGYLGYDDTHGYTNSTLLLNKDGAIKHRYDKFHLVPFGEYIPLSHILPIEPLVGIESFQKGAGPSLITNDDMPTIQPLICYEAIFPYTVDPGADIIINVTNDAWYGNGWGPRQHLNHVAWRAVENRIPIIRVAGTGISATIDSYGNISNATAYGQPASFVTTLK